ncbi:unnamed protein product [Spirodela intermedia]|uniref:Uncharacterized protein n=1 Tax=Spirodela intermedia TaxID=51605 RepID=A0A7I8KIF6_SPIIN|nr:unnamed protein product [Spirodela intermedia]
MGNCTVKGNAVGCSPREAASAANCSVRRAAVVAPCPGGGPVRVVTGSGGVLEFEGPVDVGEVLKGYPGYGIFRRGAAVSPMFHWERLHHGRLYYLLPLHRKRAGRTAVAASGGDPSLSNLEVLPPVMKGVWRVRVAMDAEDLAAVFAEEVDIEALIERMRVLAATTRGLAGATKS